MMKFTSTAKRGNGQLGTVTLFFREYRRMGILIILEKERKSGVDGKPKAEEQSVEFKKKVEKSEGTEADLDAVQRNIETAAGKVAHHTKSEREK